MPKTIKATDVVRSFSDVLNSVKYTGESYTIIRGGKPAASLIPVGTISSQKTLKDLSSIVKKLPKMEKDDADRFLQDIEESIRSQPHTPEDTSWE